MLKVILFDVDGVLIKTDGELFSTRYSKEFNIPIEEIEHFIKNEAVLCKIGKADLREELSKFLSAWKWNKSVDDLIDYWYAGEQAINNTLLNKIEKIKKLNIKCIIASDNEKYRAERILKLLNQKNVFDESFFSYNLGATKADKNFFINVLELLKYYSPEELLLCDDKQRNVDIAKQVGINAFLYTNDEGFISYIDVHINNPIV